MTQVASVRNCKVCGRSFDAKRARICSNNCRAKASRDRARETDPNYAAKNCARVKAQYAPRSSVHFIECGICGELATTRGNRPRSICYEKKCVLANNARRMREGGWANTYCAVRRGRIKETSAVEPVKRQGIFERDGWLCGICHGPVDKTLRAPDQAAPSLDHIVPVSLGGDHAPENVRLAHLGCNIRRGNRIENDHSALSDDEIRTCMADDCGADHYALGYCLAHYGDCRYRGTITKRAACAEPDCDRGRVARGYCKRHYETHFDICKADGCGSRRFKQGLCSPHYRGNRAAA